MKRLLALARKDANELSEVQLECVAKLFEKVLARSNDCLLYTSDAADD